MISSHEFIISCYRQAKKVLKTGFGGFDQITYCKKFMCIPKIRIIGWGDILKCYVQFHQNEDCEFGACSSQKVLRLSFLSVFWRFLWNIKQALPPEGRNT
jgi:hypothetical protein